MNAKRRASPRYPARRLCLILCLLCTDSGVGNASEADREISASTYTNRLIDSNDPYLLLHAHNPVDWYPWGAAALEKARRENKLIFVSIGYATCYWCHVAEREIYSNPEIARLMNQWFVNIKVDREQRPDLDELYMLATQIMTGNGGWPNNVFLTPDLKPVFAGSYFPPVETQGRKSFPQILVAIHQAWLTNRAEMLRVAEQIYQRLVQLEGNVSGMSSDKQTIQQWRNEALKRALALFDQKAGGFGHGASKFPQAPLLSLLLESPSTGQDPSELNMLRSTLLAMAEGGLMDQLAGGFHRYSTDPRWSVPHFEKMLADNVQLLSVYARTYRLTGEPYFKWVAEKTAHYLVSRMRAPQGGFFNAEDAEVAGVEGASYLWRKSEIEAILGEGAAARFFSLYTLSPVSNGADAQGVLRLDPQQAMVLLPSHKLVSRVTALAPLRVRLLSVRDKRVQPERDEKIVTADNALVVTSFVQAGEALKNQSLIDIAKQNGDWLWKNAFDASCECLSHQFFRAQSDQQAFLDDFALLGQAFMSLNRATGDIRWRQRAVRLADAMLQRFLRPDGRLKGSWDNIDLLVATPSGGDTVRPGGDSAAIGLLLELSLTDKTRRYAQVAERALSSIAGQVTMQPLNWGALLNLANQMPLMTALDRASKAALRLASSDSADHVHARGYASLEEENCNLTVTVRVDPDFHINANPASEKNLIPTELLVSNQPLRDVEYPEADLFSAKFITQDIAVYQGRIHLLAHLPTRSSDCVNIRDQVSLRVQACNETVCLAPATIAVPIANAVPKSEQAAQGLGVVSSHD